MTSARVNPLYGFAVVVGVARVPESQPEWRCLMFAVIVLSPVVAILRFGLGASIMAEAGSAS